MPVSPDSSNPALRRPGAGSVASSMFTILFAMATVLAVVMLLAACGSSSAGSTSLAGSTAASEPITADTSVAEGIPGSEEFGLTMEGLALRVEQVEAAIGACMSEAGFQYIPVDFDTIRAAQSAGVVVAGVSDEDFIAQFGFGITTLPGQEFDAMTTIAQGQNAAIFDALPVSDQVAYTRTLLGENPDITFVVGLEDEDFSETDGCTRSSVEQSFSEQEIAGTYVNPGDILIDNDPRMVDAIAAWSGCLAEDGHDYDTPDDLDDDLMDRLDAILGDQDPADLIGTSSQALTELQGFERSVAPLSNDCDEQFIVPVEEQIETELYGAPQG